MNDTPTEPGAERHSPGHWLLASVALLVLGVLAIVVIGIVQPNAAHGSRSVTLPDGTKLEVLGAVVGTNQFTTEKAWERLARKVLPAKYQKWIPQPFTSQDFNQYSLSGSITGFKFSGWAIGRRLNLAPDTNLLTVFLRVQNIKPAAPRRNFFSFGNLPFAAGEAVDNSGISYPVANIEASATTVSNSQPVEEVIGLSFKAAPRRQKSFELHLLDAKGAVIARLLVRNPPHPPFPEWHPLPLPQSVTNGSLALTLERLEQRDPPQQPPATVWGFHSTAPGWTNATVTSLTFFDATGNEGTNLSPREPAWKLRVQVKREWAAGADPPEKLVVTNLAIPATASFIGIDRATNFGDVRVKVMLIAGASELVFYDGVSTNGFPPPLPFQQVYGGWRVIGKVPYVLVEITDIKSASDVGFRLRDQQGREIEFQQSLTDASSRPAGPNSRLYQLYFKPDADVKSLTLEAFVARRRDFFSFMVNPKDAKPAKP